VAGGFVLLNRPSPRSTQQGVPALQIVAGFEI
jgi:hypothetical protein